jgi:hypothetical protein
MLPTLEISHSLHAQPLRLCDDAVDHDLLLEDSSVVTFAGWPMTSLTFEKGAGGRVSGGITLGNEGGVLDAWFEALAGSAELPVVKLRWFGDDLLLLPRKDGSFGPSILLLHEPHPINGGAGIEAELRSRSDNDLPAQRLVRTLENTPTLRGMK